MSDLAPMLRQVLGGLAESTPDDRLGMPLDQQIHELVELACAVRPDFRRTVPVSPHDHDVLISDVLRKLYVAIAELEAENRRLRRRLVRWTHEANELIQELPGHSYFELRQELWARRAEALGVDE